MIVVASGVAKLTREFCELCEPCELLSRADSVVRELFDEVENCCESFCRRWRSRSFFFAARFKLLKLFLTWFFTCCVMTTSFSRGKTFSTASEKAQELFYYVNSTNYVKSLQHFKTQLCYLPRITLINQESRTRPLLFLPVRFIWCASSGVSIRWYTLLTIPSAELPPIRASVTI